MQLLKLKKMSKVDEDKVFIYILIQPTCSCFMLTFYCVYLHKHNIYIFFLRPNVTFILFFYGFTLIEDMYFFKYVHR